MNARRTAAAAVLALVGSTISLVSGASAQTPGYETGVIGEVVKAWPVGIGLWSDECRILNRHDGGYDLACNSSGSYFVPYKNVARLNGPAGGATPAIPAAATPAGGASGVPGYETGVIGEVVKAWPVGIGLWSDECRILNRHDGGYDLACNSSGSYFVPYKNVARLNGPTAAAPKPAQPPAADDPDPVIPKLTRGTYRCYDDDDVYANQNVVITSTSTYKDRRGKTGRYRQNDDVLTFTSGPYKGWDASVDEDGMITLTNPKTDVTTSCRRG